MHLFLCLQFPRSDARSHSQTQIEIHLNLALRGLDAIQHQVHELVTVVKDQSQQIERQSGQIKRLTSKDKVQSEQIGRLSEKVERLISKDKEQSEKMERLMSTVEDQSAQREQRGPINQISPTPFEFKIPNFENVCQRARTSAQVLFSEPFYLFARGYKHLLRIEIHLREWLLLRHCKTENACFELRVFIKVVPGKFDESLSWPCKEKVRVTLIGQHLPLDNRENISRVIDFGGVPCSRPLRDDYDNDRFILQLRGYELLSCTKDDTILIRVNRE